MVSLCTVFYADSRMQSGHCKKLQLQVNNLTNEEDRKFVWLTTDTHPHKNNDYAFLLLLASRQASAKCVRVTDAKTRKRQTKGTRPALRKTN